MTTLRAHTHRSTGRRRTARARVISSRIQAYNRRILQHVYQNDLVGFRANHRREDEATVQEPQRELVTAALPEQERSAGESMLHSTPGLSGGRPDDRADNGSNGNGSNGRQNGKLKQLPAYYHTHTLAEITASWAIDDATRLDRLDEANRAKNLPGWLIEYDRKFDPVQVCQRYMTQQYFPQAWDKRG
jgi:hypothetical protein